MRDPDDDLASFFPPPPDFAARSLPIASFTGPWQRIHACEYGAVFFGTTGRTRFRAPNGEYGVMYMGSDLLCAFVETFGRLGRTAESDLRVIDVNTLHRRCVSEIKATRPLRLVNLTATGLRRIGADARLCAGEHLMARQWALAMWQHPDQPDGILYPARHDLSRWSVAVFGRAAAALEADTARRLIDLPPAVLGAILDTYGFSLASQ